MTSLQNKTALVTDASRGIGRATAAALAKAGHMSWFTMAAPLEKRNLSSARSTPKVEAVLDEMDAKRVRVKISPMDEGAAFEPTTKPCRSPNTQFRS
jgi:NAD(P)-dependent dehydrogenase (short-subunit alcohol dehydrogenase family)